MHRIQQWFFQLNRRQIRALFFGSLVMVLMGLNPPWDHVFQNEMGGVRVQPAGFHFISNPPLQSGIYNWYTSQVDVRLLLAEWLVTSLVIAGFMYGLRDKNREANAVYGQYR